MPLTSRRFETIGMDLQGPFHMHIGVKVCRPSRGVGSGFGGVGQAETVGHMI